MTDTKHHDSTATNNADFPSATSQAHQTAGYEIKAYRSDPRECVTAKDQDAISAPDLYLKTPSKTAALAHFRFVFRSGYWLEIFDSQSGELLAGPFDPDQLAPKFVL